MPKIVNGKSVPFVLVPVLFLLVLITYGLILQALDLEGS